MPYLLIIFQKGGYLRMKEWGVINKIKKELEVGNFISEISRKSGIDRKTVRKYRDITHEDIAKNHFLPFLIKLGQAMGLDIQLVTADEAYHDKDGSLFLDILMMHGRPPFWIGIWVKNTIHYRGFSALSKCFY